MGTAGREEGHSMVYRAPKSGVIVLSVKDDEPYLRQNGNSGGKVELSFTHNGSEISSYELSQSLVKVDVEPMEIQVNKGDFIRVEARNIENPSKPSIHITPRIVYKEVELADKEAPTTPTNLKVENITENSADISWEASKDNVGVVAYEIYNGNKLLTVVSDENFVTLNNLEAGVEYNLSIRAVDAAGNKSEPGNVSFKTEEIKSDLDTEAPTVPSNIKVDKVTTNSAYISWRESTDNVGVVAYKVYNGDKLLATVKDKTSIEIGNLKSGTKYELSIKAIDEVGNESEAGTISFTTKKASSNSGGDNGNLLPQTGGALPFEATSISIIAITLGTIVLRKKDNK